MKITDYAVIVAATTDELRLAVMAKGKEGWEVYGGPMLLQKPVTMMQAMVRKFDVHADEVWVKEPGQRGRWVKANSTPTI